jgi:protein-tyrosine-phosphatase
MRELGIDISGHRSKGADEFAGQQFDYVLTVCDNAKERCPMFPGKTVTIHHNFERPRHSERSFPPRTDGKSVPPIIGPNVSCPSSKPGADPPPAPTAQVIA